ncbi:histidine phosphatase family protein [Escherichia coli]
MRLWLIRHGETQANVDGLYSGHAPTPLTARGIEQAQNLHTLLQIARLIGMPAEAMWHFRVDQGCWSTIDINQKFATLRVLNSRAIGVENA